MFQRQSLPGLELRDLRWFEDGRRPYVETREKCPGNAKCIVQWATNSPIKYRICPFDAKIKNVYSKSYGYNANPSCNPYTYIEIHIHTELYLTGKLTIAMECRGLYRKILTRYLPRISIDFLFWARDDLSHMQLTPYVNITPGHHEQNACHIVTINLIFQVTSVMVSVPCSCGSSCELPRAVPVQVCPPPHRADTGIVLLC